MIKQLEFNSDLWALAPVQTFTCGEREWEVEVGKWIAAPAGDPESALYCIEQGRCSVWLYTLPADDSLDIVGFTSLGRTSWGLQKRGEKTPIQIVPNFAVALRYQGQPRDVPKAERYAYKMFGDLIAEAGRRWKFEGASQLLGLHVHPMNERAIQFYENPTHKLSRLPKPIQKGYITMIRAIEESDVRE